MKKTLLILSFIIALGVLVTWTPNVLAYSNHSSCRNCHSITYDNARHAFHRDATADFGVSCDICHDNNQVKNSCAVCHDAAPLQSNHINNYGVASCQGCHPQPECTVNADCDDGIFCNGAETCNAGFCMNGTPPTCDDWVACTVDSCDATSDACVNTPDDFACPDDGLFCTGDVTCDPDAGCMSTGNPCPEWITSCNEDTDTCDPSGESVKGLPWQMLLLDQGLIITHKLQKAGSDMALFFLGDLYYLLSILSIYTHESFLKCQGVQWIY